MQSQKLALVWVNILTIVVVVVGSLADARAGQRFGDATGRMRRGTKSDEAIHTDGDGRLLAAVP